MASRTAHRRTGRHPIGSTVLFVALVTLPWAFAARADAVITEVSVDPTSGPVGTVVTVNGGGCPPGVLFPSRAGVVILTLGVNIDLAVPPNGEWSAQFVVPSGALQGPHAIVVTCTLDLVPLPYLPLTFTVTVPEPPPPSTTIAPAGTTTTTVTSTLPTTTITSTFGGSTTTLAPSAVAPGDSPGPDDGAASGTAPTEAPTTTPDTTRSVANAAAPSTSHAVSVAVSEEVITAARSERVDRGRPLVFGALSPIGRGWMGVIISILLVAAFMSAIVALLWFRWLRHTRAREWWIRWLHQILRIRAHASPPP